MWQQLNPPIVSRLRPKLTWFRTTRIIDKFCSCLPEDATQSLCVFNFDEKSPVHHVLNSSLVSLVIRSQIWFHFMFRFYSSHFHHGQWIFQFPRLPSVIVRLPIFQFDVFFCMWIRICNTTNRKSGGETKQRKRGDRGVLNTHTTGKKRFLFFF